MNVLRILARLYRGWRSSVGVGWRSVGCTSTALVTVIGGMAGTGLHDGVVDVKGRDSAVGATPVL